MVKTLVTCTARSPRGVNVFSGPKNSETGQRPVESVILQPGESRPLELVDEEHPALQGMITNREISIGEEIEELSEEEEKERQEEVFRNDPIFRATQESAAAAARTPGLADPLPRAQLRESRERREATKAKGGRKGRAAAGDDDE